MTATHRTPTTDAPTTLAPASAAHPLSMSPTGRLLTAALVVAPLVYLAADATYAARGWDDGTAGVLHVLGAVAYGFVVLRVVAWLPPGSRLAALVLLVGMLGTAGNVAYGIDTLHVSLGDTSLVDRSGVAVLIKPLGLFFPLSFTLVAVALWRLGQRWQGALVLAASLAWPVAHIGDVAPLAVAVDVVLVVALGSLAWPAGRASRR